MAEAEAGEAAHKAKAEAEDAKEECAAMAEAEAGEAAHKAEAEAEDAKEECAAMAEAEAAEAAHKAEAEAEDAKTEEEKGAEVSDQYCFRALCEWEQVNLGGGLLPDDLLMMKPPRLRITKSLVPS